MSLSGLVGSFRDLFSQPAAEHSANQRPPHHETSQNPPAAPASIDIDESSLVLIESRKRTSSIRQNLSLSMANKHPVNFRTSFNPARPLRVDFSRRFNQSFAPQQVHQQGEHERWVELRRKKQAMLDRSRQFVLEHAEFVPKTAAKPVPELGTKEKRVLESFMQLPKSQLLGEIFKVELFAEDLQRLLLGQWLNDSIIDAYLAQLTESTNTFAFTTHFYTKLAKEGPKAVKRWTIRKKVNLTEKDRVLIPVNRGNMHWCLAVVDNKNNNIVFYDSLHGSGNDVVENLQKYMVFEADRLGAPAKYGAFAKEPHGQCPQQENGYDCGVFLCQNATQVTQDQPLHGFSQKDIPNVRDNIAYRLLSLAKGL